MDSCSVFAYGTLKTNQLRASLWPRKPVRIEPAVAQGQLWDLGSYPGLCLGSDWILGELWTFQEQDLQVTLDALDEIEGYDPNQDQGLYLRRLIDVHILSDRTSDLTLQSFVYRIPDIRKWPLARRIEPWMDSTWPHKLAVWPDANARVPKDLSDEDQ